MSPNGHDPGFYRFLKAISIIMIVLGIILLFGVPIIGIFMIVCGICIIKIPQKDSTTSHPPKSKIQAVPKCTKPKPFTFPEIDASGNKLLKTVSYTLTGVNHTHLGSDPQKVISKKLRGSQLELRADVENEYDPYAVMVLYDGKYIGWLPAKNEDYRERDAKIRIFQHLTSGVPVLAKFDDISTIKISQWDYDDEGDEDDGYFITQRYITADITCAIYEQPNAGKTII